MFFFSSSSISIFAPLLRKTKQQLEADSSSPFAFPLSLFWHMQPLLLRCPKRGQDKHLSGHIVFPLCRCKQLHVAISGLGSRVAPAAHLLHADTDHSHNIHLCLKTGGTTEAVWWYTKGRKIDPGQTKVWCSNHQLTKAFLIFNANTVSNPITTTILFLLRMN